MKIKGIKKAVGDYNRANAGGWYSPSYGEMMINRRTGEVWTDEFYSLGHQNWNVYHDGAVVNIGAEIMADGDRVTMATVRKKAEEMCDAFRASEG